jgi:perosamine synthetase
MVPRKKLDIGWRDLGWGLAYCLWPPRDAARALEQFWSGERHALATLSVRSGLDLVLQQLALPEGSEVLVSAITIRDIVTILEHHGLRAVPVDIDPATCAVRADLLEASVTDRTRAVLVAHLFGSRMPLDDVAAVARRHGLFLFEDCAQAFAADGYRGHADSHVSMFSFGPIKTATALGGGVLRFREAWRCEEARHRQAHWPVQSRARYARRLLKYALLKALSWRIPYTLFVALCRRWGRSHDQVIAGAVRGFPAGDLLPQLRCQPSAALLALLRRRVTRYSPQVLAQRIEAAAAVTSGLPAEVLPGSRAPTHCHWVVPIRCTRPDALVQDLWRLGFDATRGATSLHAVAALPTTTGVGSAAAHDMMGELVYLPVEASTRAEREALGRAVRHLLLQS